MLESVEEVRQARGCVAMGAGIGLSCCSSESGIRRMGMTMVAV